MNPTVTAPSPVAFQDGLGERRHTSGAGNQPIEVLILNEELTGVPSFEASLRERVDQLAAFQHPAYAKVRGVGRLSKGQARLVVASDLVAGVRLSEILSIAEQRLIPLEIDAALCLLRQIVPAVAALHAKTPDACHGALAPERIIVTADARVAIVEHVYGSALEQLRFSHERYWKELRIPLPLTGGLPRFDRRADVTQIGALALALILGRPLGEEEYPTRIADLVDGVRAISATGLEVLPTGVRGWLTRCLQLDPRRSFATAIEAQAEFEAIVGVDERPLQDALVSFLAQCHSAVGRPEGPAPAAPPVAIAIEAPLPSPEPVPASVPMKDPEPRVRVERMAASSALPEPEAPLPVELEAPAAAHWWRGRLMVAGVVIVAVATGGTLAARHLMMQGPSTGALVVNTNPPGAQVVVDGTQRGVTPLSIDLTPGKHTLAVAADGQARTIPVTITSGSQVAQFIELPKTASVEGQLQVRTEPAGATVTVDGQRRGVSPLVIGGLSAGSHAVVLENALGSVTEQVTIAPGATASLVVPLAGPQGVPVSGWISIAAPVDMQVFEDRRLLGSSQSERIMLSVGRHNLELTNDALGFRASRVVQVTPGRVTPIRIDLPKGSMALNAVPWAEVWVDGDKVGETPIGNVSVSIGTHDVLFRHPELGEQRQAVTVTLSGPARVSVDFRKR
jgi:hypothetical protein